MPEAEVDTNVWPRDVSEDSIERFAEDLRELREAAGWSQRQLAAKANFVPESISAAERGRRIPTELVVRGYVRTTGGSPEEVERWQERCRQLRLREGYKPPGRKSPSGPKAAASSAPPVLQDTSGDQLAQTAMTKAQPDTDRLGVDPSKSDHAKSDLSVSSSPSTHVPARPSVAASQSSPPHQDETAGDTSSQGATATPVTPSQPSSAPPSPARTSQPQSNRTKSRTTKPLSTGTRPSKTTLPMTATISWAGRRKHLQKRLVWLLVAILAVPAASVAVLTMVGDGEGVSDEAQSSNSTKTARETLSATPEKVSIFNQAVGTCFNQYIERESSANGQPLAAVSCDNEAALVRFSAVGTDGEVDQKCAPNGRSKIARESKTYCYNSIFRAGLCLPAYDDENRIARIYDIPIACDDAMPLTDMKKPKIENPIFRPVRIQEVLQLDAPAPCPGFTATYDFSSINARLCVQVSDQASGV